ncbi:hypothetical protein [Pedobacter sp. GR22-10]|uniref:hypothetical protein n=1 Tax=Pedobacter sp. GR22-10 TaxID=2994472 RepID=UPI0022471AA8|nr:hypothetical protein [Pedobacter sp. GR22-10]MCX2429844.1 hypothetical protein [Pedobacter sp. GR22-10]
MEKEGISENLQSTSGYGVHQSVTKGLQQGEVLRGHKERQLAYTQQIVERSDIYIGKREIKQQVTIEYPSGAKLSVDASDLSLIAKLVRL